jgi:nucleotide-binding universal stress UspA family protein
MKKILVPIGGSATDEGLLATALQAARPFSSHLQFVHVHIGAGEAMPHVPHADFAMGPALSNLVERLDIEAHTRSSVAAQNFQDFCARAKIQVRETPSGMHGVTASWQEEEGQALERIISYARHSDLVVVGRAKRANGLPADFLDQLLMGSGSPILIASSAFEAKLTQTVMVCWKESPEAARAVGAAMPFLTNAERVVIASVAESGEDIARTMDELVHRLAWNGIAAETRVVAPEGKAIPEVLGSLARECGANLVVMGAYGRSRMREILFGGCTLEAIRHAEQSVLLMH